MSDDDDSLKGLGEFTEVQKKLLAEAIVTLEGRIFTSVVSKFKIYIAIGILVLTGFGIVTFTGVRSDVVKTASAAMSSDSAIRERIEKAAVKSIEVDVKTLNDMKKRLDDLFKEAEASKDRENLILRNSTEKLRAMVDQLEELMPE